MAYLSALPTPVIEVLMEGPAAFTPSGITAASTINQNLDIPNTIAIVFAVTISTLALGFRLYTKLVLIKQWNIEDFLVVFAWTLLMYYSAESELAMQSGAGRHMWNIATAEFFTAVYHINITSILYCIIAGLLKVAILLQYVRVFVPNRNGSKGLRYTLYAALVVIVLFYVIITFCTIFICFPREAYWDPYIKGTCLDWQTLSQAVAIFTVISDFTLLIIPIFPVRKLHIARKKKIMIGLLFAVGFIDCVASIVRAYYTWYLVDSPDISWNTVYMGIWAWIEMAFGIVVVCLPVSPRFYKHVRDRSSALVSSWRSSKPLGIGSSQGSSGTTNLSSAGSHIRPHFSSFHQESEKEINVERPEKAVLTKEDYEFEELSEVKSQS